MSQFDRLRYGWRDAWQSIVLTRGVMWGSLLAIAFSLILVGLSLAARTNLAYFTQQVQTQSIVTAYLHPGDAPAEIDQARRAIAGRPGVLSVQYVSSQKVLAQMQVTLGRDRQILNEIGNVNPFTGYLAINVDPARAGSVAQFASRQGAIALVSDNRTVLNRLAQLTRTANWLGAGILLLSSAVALVVIAHVIRLSLYIRREDVQTLRWMGASEGFVALPFVLQGTMVGAGGGIAAAVILAGALLTLERAAASALPFVPFLSGWGLWLASGWVLVALGTVCGGIGSLVAWAGGKSGLS